MEHQLCALFEKKWENELIIGIYSIDWHRIHLLACFAMWYLATCCMVKHIDIQTSKKKKDKKKKRKKKTIIYQKNGIYIYHHTVLRR